MDFNLATSFTEPQAYGVLDNSVAGLNMYDDLATMYLTPGTFDHNFEQATDVTTMDPNQISH